MLKKPQKLVLPTSILYFIFLGAVCWWCLMIIAAPIFSHGEEKLTSGLLYIFFSKICHQISDRSFFIFERQFAVCSRCTGLYFGFLLGTLIYPFIHKLKRRWLPAKKYFYIALVPIAVDISIRFFRVAENTFTSRLMTGLILGVTTVFFILPGFLSLNQNQKIDNQ